MIFLWDTRSVVRRKSCVPSVKMREGGRTPRFDGASQTDWTALKSFLKQPPTGRPAKIGLCVFVCVCLCVCVCVCLCVSVGVLSLVIDGKIQLIDQ